MKADPDRRPSVPEVASQPAPSDVATPVPTADRVLFQVRESTVARIFGWVRRFLTMATVGYCAALILALIALEWWGERHWLLSVFLYAPAQLLLLPLLVLSPLCLLVRWRLIFWHLGVAVILLFGYMGFHWSSVPKPTPSTVTAVSFNHGESSRSQFMEFLQTEKPDLIILQDARNRGVDMARKIPGMNASDMGQFVLLSRFPIGKAEFVEAAKVGSSPVAARWEVLIQGRTTAIYSVHLPTPRRELSKFLSKRFLIAGLIGYGDRLVAFGEYRAWIRERIELAQALAKVFADEKAPMIVAGDFNTPDHGHIYHLFADQMTDAFAHAGRGWGLTFPGNTRNPISLYGPWLRLDYFFTGRGWKPTECRPEPGKKSQHKAVLARFEPLPVP